MIKNCPLCSKPPQMAPVFHYFTGEKIGYGCHCSECLISSPKGKDKNSATENWNREVERYLK